MGKDNTLLLVGAAGAAYFLFIKPQMTAAAQQAAIPASPGTPYSGTPVPGSNTTNVIAPTTNYPYLTADAPLPLPAGFNQTYYLQYVYPAMLQMNGNVGSHDYVFTSDEANQYLANYVDIQEWIKSLPTNKTPLQHLVYHWQTYAVPEQRTFLPLWSANPSQWVPPPPAKHSGIFKDILMGVTAVAGVVITAAGTVVTLGTTTVPLGALTAAALTAESQIKGVQQVGFNGDDSLSDEECQILFTGSAVLIDILPFYNQANNKVVKQINNKLHLLLNQYS